MNHTLKKHELAALLHVTPRTLLDWHRQGAPIGRDGTGDPLQVCCWYNSERPIFRMSVETAFRLERFRELGLRLLSQRRKAKKLAKAAEAQKR